MPWVRFTADMDWKPNPSVTIAYKCGDTKNVTRTCASRAVEVGKAVRMTKNSKDREPCPVQDDSASA